jgi:hypothetical protein
MHAFLITGADPVTRMSALEALLNKNHVLAHNCATLTLAEGEAAYGIALIRAWQGQLALAPLGEGAVAGIIPQAHLLTHEAQQALLKTLEEPPGSALVILETETPFALLPTILSRVQILNCTSANKPQENSAVIASLQKARGATVGEIVRISDTLAPSRNAAETFLGEVTQALQQQLVAPLEDNTIFPRGRTALILRAALEARKQLGANVTPRLAVDRFLLTLQAGQA